MRGLRTMMRIKKLLSNLMAMAPITIPAMLAAFGVVAMVLLIAGKLEDRLVWPLGGLAAVIACIAASRLPRTERPGTPREQRWFDGLAIVFVLAWGAGNVLLSSQHIFTNRDPATYANTAAWLVTHNDLAMKTPELFKGVAGFTNDSPGFETFGGDQASVSAQGQHLFPVLLGLAGRVAGIEHMLHLPPLIGAIGLLAVYGLARMLVRPRWALLAVVALGVSLPMLYFSRDTYTEPLTMCFMFAGLATVLVAHQSRRTAAWILAGLLFGASALARIDVYISIAGLLLFIAIAMSGLRLRERKKYVLQVLAFLVILAGLSVVAFIDMAHLSQPYLAFHKGLLKQEILGLGAVAAVSAVFVILAWNTKLLRTVKQLTRRKQYIILAVAILAIGLLLASRPLWFVGHTHGQDANIAALQTREHLTVEPRSYTEQSVNWVAWYIGAPLATLGFVGMALGVAQARRERVLLLGGVTMVFVTGVIYFVQPSVAPDQIWASRRYLPMVLPGLLLFAMIPLDFLWQRYANKFLLRQAVAIVVVGAVLLTPLLVSRPFLRHRDVVQAPIITDVCKALPKNAAVLWVGDGQYYLVQPTRSFCNVPAFAYTSRDLNWQSIEKVATSMRSAGYQPVLAVMNGDKPILGKRMQDVTQASDFTFREMEMRLSGPPRFADTKTMGVSLLGL